MKTILVDAWNTFVTKEGVNEKMKALLDSFPNPKIIVTNANATERQTYGIVSMPYTVFSLSHKPNKTAPEFFIKLMDEFQFTPGNLVYFEHNQEAVASAQSLGITSFLYNKDDSDLEELTIFLKSSV